MADSLAYPMALLYLLRHGESHVNISRTFSYLHVDLGLTARGVEQARAVANYFADKPIRRVFSGPLQRARQTAEPIARTTGAPLEIVEPLRELNVGSLEGRSDSAGWDMHDSMLRRWRAGDWDARFPDGESYHEVHARITGFLDRLANEFPNQDLVAVGHGGIFCAVLPRVCPIPWDPGTPFTLGNTAVSIFTRGAAITCVQWNGLTHLG
jgi:broad specificity phosphatase PhoE